MELTATIERIGNLIGDTQRKLERLARSVTELNRRVEALEDMFVELESEEIEGQIGFIGPDEEADIVNGLGWTGAQP
jgi:hypothetical protein